jgi:hypothetical protein
MAIKFYNYFSHVIDSQLGVANVSIVFFSELDRLKHTLAPPLVFDYFYYIYLQFNVWTKYINLNPLLFLCLL